ncbi:malectin domain-containing carbohydrate-binding protein [Oscillatoria salina]|uniref:malectin domain-containing carbohydrate-binding protein n=1 Tax=Oscillatoria salina TaxID=331517 RepID=UPI0013BB3C6A|nr:malectin domain-containing carbohydrate-binding protein [Oscillatoria salina]MBZ8181001.1 hypothetical protein [Oscillatoria salina IIICB1]NET88122.1 hypothetical protein [Kamptonema sp. SIO1D9]
MANGKALFQIDPPGSNIHNSTYNNGSFSFKNESQNGLKIANISLDLSTAIFPDLVFDPYGQAGDPVGKDFQVNNEGGTGYNGFSYDSLHDDGYDVVNINFTDFDPGENFSFSIDNDPTSVRGMPAPGPGESASISGLELTGATITITFEDGSITTARTFRKPDSLDGSQAYVQAQLPVAPTLEIVGVTGSNSIVNNANQIARISGPSGEKVRLLLVEGALFTDNGYVFDPDPFEANTAIGVNEFSGTIGADGTLDIPVTLTRSDDEGGLNHLVAVIEDSNGVTGELSTISVLEYLPDSNPANPSLIIEANGVAVTEGGAGDSYTVVLGSAPTSEVIVNLSNNGQVSTNLTQLSFDASNWNQPQTVTVTAVDDNVDEADVHTGQIVHTIDTTDPDYSSLSPESLNIAVSDNDTPPPPSSNAIRINVGGGEYTDSNGNLWAADSFYANGKTYSIGRNISGTNDDALYQSERYAKNLAYDIPVDNGDYQVKLHFAEIYWNASNKRVFDTYIEDQLILNDLDLYDIAGKDTAYVYQSDVTVNDGQLDLDFSTLKDHAKLSAIELIPLVKVTPNVIIQPDNLTVSEGGGGQNYSLVLTTAPTSEVTINLSNNGQVSSNLSQLSFDASNWNQPQTITVTAVDDNVDEADVHTGQIAHTIDTTDPDYSSLSLPSLTVAVNDNDSNVPPPSNAIRINVGGGEYTDSNGNLWAADSFYANGKTYSIGRNISGTNDDVLYQSERYAKNLAYDIPVDNGDYQIKLHFAEIYWNASNKRVFDTYIEDQLILNDLDLYDIAGADTAYIYQSDVTVNDGQLDLDFSTLTDNAKLSAIELISLSEPNPGLEIQETNGSTDVTEGGNSDSYSVALKTAPSDTVTVTLSNNGQVSTNPTQLIFTPENWDLPQLVTVSAVDDTEDEAATHSDLITHAIASADNNYGSLSPISIDVSVSDNDTDIEPPNPSVIRINAGGSEYTDPLGNVWEADQHFIGGGTYSTTDDIVHPDGIEDDPIYQTERFGTNFSYAIPVDNGAYQVKLHFAEIYWEDFNQRVFDVSAEGILEIDDLDIYSVTDNAFFEGHDTEYTSSIPQVVVQDGVLNLNFVASKDNAKISAIELIPISGPHVILENIDPDNTIYEGGIEGSDSYQYSIELNSQPSSDVTIHLDGNNSQISLSHNSVTFTPSNWNQPQTITLTAVDDEIEEPNQTVYISHTAISQDDDYNGISIEDRPVQVKDDDGVEPEFEIIKTISSNNPSTAAWGPDGRLYVGSAYGGKITIYEFDDDYNVIDTQQVNTLQGLSNSSILGIAFNPYDTSDSPTIYVTHSQLYANGGGAFPETELSPYSGQVSLLEGPNFSSLTPLITGLPVSNHDHGINGIDFDNNGDLYIAVGGNTNAGIEASAIGGIPESPFSAAILKAEISKPDFNGAIEYTLPDDFVPPDGLTFDPADSQTWGDEATVVPGVDISVYASGLRNPYDLVWGTNNKLYATDNGANGGFGQKSTSATTQEPFSGGSEPDQLHAIEEGKYYGHPNRSRGQTDPVQNVYYGATDPENPAFESPLALFSPSTNGIAEYRAEAFGGGMRGTLLAQKYNGQLYNIALNQDGSDVDPLTGDNGVTQVKDIYGNHAADGLDVIIGPGGAIVGVDYQEDNLTVATPVDPTAVNPSAYDIFPWRAPAVGGNEFVIGGLNFDPNDTSVTIGGELANITSVSDNRIRGILPSFDNPTSELLDVVVSSGSTTSVIEDAFLPLTGAAVFV